MQRIRTRLSFANVVSLIALFVALGGSSYAAVTLARNTVGAAQIKAGGVGSSEVKNGSLLRKDFKRGQLPAGATGPQGAQGPQGPAGERGATGAFGAATVQFEQATVDLADGTSASYNAFCLDGQQAIGGGARGDDFDSEDTAVTSSRPAISSTNTGAPIDGQGFTGWRTTVRNLAGGVAAGIRPEVWVICVPAP